jgi:hypothetical protein
MKAALTALVAVAFVFSTAKADDKEVTLKGTITCLKCDLKKADKCATVIKVKDKDKEVVYLFDEVSGKKHHSKICTKPTPGTVKGTVTKDGDKLIIKVTDVKFE